MVHVDGILGGSSTIAACAVNYCSVRRRARCAVHTCCVGMHRFIRRAKNNIRNMHVINDVHVDHGMLRTVFYLMLYMFSLIFSNIFV